MVKCGFAQIIKQSLLEERRLCEEIKAAGRLQANMRPYKACEETVVT